MKTVYEKNFSVIPMPAPFRLPEPGRVGVDLALEIVFLTGPDSRKARNLRRDPRVALSLTEDGNPYSPVVVRGRVDGFVADENVSALSAA